MTEIKGDYYPRKAALLQEDEISKLQVQVNLLRTENAELKEKLTQYEQGRPMSEAPRSGERILVRSSKDRIVDTARWNEDLRLWYVISEGKFFSEDNFDRWWPLPGSNTK